MVRFMLWLAAACGLFAADFDLVIRNARILDGRATPGTARTWA